jgi:hypothetical protein
MAFCSTSVWSHWIGFELPSLRNTQKHDKTKKIEGEMAVKILSMSMFL